ncbi:MULTISPECIES: DUF2975 domain-containing protein [Nonomuraea]|uniref:DUF2975 domain-containing protein n=1 Tax=Nonomuraea ferruginea TaxID=46174 RepID=A0ABT4STG7_9ACTN|nr:MULTISPECIES: DUF2975 domain-containing protein [Nonomuraea]MDA0640553.1 DUF2975 domain-containing protein [Nonomuraea ferruginea]
MSTKWLTRLENLLTLLFVLACLGALGLLLSTGLIAFSGTASGVGVPLRIFDVPVTGMAAPDAAIISASADVTVRHQGPAPLVGLLYLLVWAPGVTTTLLAMFTVVRALRRARSGDRMLFSAVTAAHLRRLGWILIVGSLATGLLGMVAEPILASMLLAKSYSFYPPSGEEVAGVVTGVAVLAVSEIVRRGLVLLEEVEATI